MPIGKRAERWLDTITDEKYNVEFLNQLSDWLADVTGNANAAHRLNCIAIAMETEKGEKT